MPVNHFILYQTAKAEVGQKANAMRDEWLLLWEAEEGCYCIVWPCVLAQLPCRCKKCSIVTERTKEAIVVGIDHGAEKRMTEYNPYDFARFGKGEGSLYVDFLATTLKPYIDKKYRTQKDPAHTFVAGSSMGGLNSLYAIMKYPKLFGGAGVFSPAFWTAPAIYDEIKNISQTTTPKFFFYAGGKEGDAMVPDMEKMVKLIESKGSYLTRTVISPLNKHNEQAWRKEFPDFYKWIMQ